MKTAWSIDWLSVTFKNGVSDLELRKALSFGFPLKTWQQTQPRFGYSAAFTHPLGLLVMANYGRPEMGVHLALSGRALKSLAEGGQSATAMLDWVIKQDGKITRLDLAIDAFEVEINPLKLAACPRVALDPGTARKWSSVESANGGKTAYIGSRKSERFLRVYDKAAEQGRQGELWTRFEIELKGQSARVAGQAMSLLSDAERPHYIKGLIKALFNPDDETFRQVINADAVLLETTKDTDDNTVDWLINSVAKTIAKTMVRRADVDLWNEICVAVHSNLVALGALDLAAEQTGF